MPPSTRWQTIQAHAKSAWKVFAATANPRTMQQQDLDAADASHEHSSTASTAAAAKFESIDYYKSYPDMYMRHLRNTDWRNVPLPAAGHSEEEGLIDAPTTSAVQQLDRGSDNSDEGVCSMFASRHRARTAAHAIVEEVTAYDASSRNSTLRWLLHVLIALSVGLVASGITYSVAALEDWKAETLYSIVVGNDNRSLGYFLGLLFWSGTSTAMVAIGTAVVVWFEPAAGGSGIPDVIAYLNGVMKPKVVSLRTFAAKSISCIFAVAGGLPVGVEAPLIHLGAITGAGVTQGRSRTLGCQTRLFQAFRNNKDRRDFITAGAACGVSAAFGAPIGGLLFVMEEVSSFWDHSAAGQIFLASMISFSTIAFINSLAENDHTVGRVTNSAAVLFEVNIKIPLNLLAIVPALFLGAMCGLLAVAFTKCSLIVSKWRRRVLRPHMWRRFAEPLTIVVGFTFIMFVLALIPNCVPTSSANDANESASVKVWHTENVSSLVNMTCHEPGSYSPLATLALQSTKRTIRHLFNRESVAEFPAGDVFVFFLVYTVFACWASGTFIASGLVVPTLCMGAAFGRLFGLFLVHAFSTNGAVPNAYLSSESWMDPGVFALIGAGALLGGINRMAMSICVIMVELSGELHYLLPIMVSIVLSKAVADWLCEPLFHHMLHLEHVPYLPMNLHKEFEQLTAADVMQPNVLTLCVRDSTANILHALRTTTHHAFPVLAEEVDVVSGGVSSPPVSPGLGNRSASPLLMFGTGGNNSLGSDSRSKQTNSPPPPLEPLSSSVPPSPTASGGLQQPRRMKFIGVVTREDIQVFLSLPSLQHFAVNEGREANAAATSTIRGAMLPDNNSNKETTAGHGRSGSATSTPPPSVVREDTDDSDSNSAHHHDEAATQALSPQYRHRLAVMMRRINAMSWIDWMSHQTSLFFVTGDKLWHRNWNKVNAPSTLSVEMNGASPGRPPVSPLRIEPLSPSTPSSSFSNPYFVDERQLPLFIDLSLIVNRSPWVIPPFFNLNMAYSTFRSMGLRHMVVVDGDAVRGMITRKDLLIDTLRRRLTELHLRLREAAMAERTRRALERARSGATSSTTGATAPTVSKGSAASASTPTPETKR